nr:phosphatidylinositol 3-kinase [Cryptococcus depauperatus CBS 7855]
MSGNTYHHILHRSVPLICQALITSPEDETVWLEGLRLMSSPKLRPALASTSSIWLPLLLKGLEVTKPRTVTREALKLLYEAAGTLDVMKSCLVKPLRTLSKERDASEMEEFAKVLERLDINIRRGNKENRSKSALDEGKNVAPDKPTESQQQHPLLGEILAHNLPPKPRSVQHAWSQTLFVSAHDSPAVWLHNLYQATLEASNVPELVITSRLGQLIHNELFHTAFLKCYQQVEEDAAFMSAVDKKLVSLLSDANLSEDVVVAILNLLAFCSKEKVNFSPSLQEAAKTCALKNFQGALNQPLPGIILWYMEQNAEAFPTQENVSNLVEANIRVGSAGYDAAWSSLLWLENDWKVEPEPMWITSLSHWQRALDAQNKIDQRQKITMYSSFNIQMICYHALGDFQKGYKLAQEYFEGLDDNERRNTAHWATAAAWHMGDFDTMADYLAFHPKGTSKSLYKAIIDVHNEQYASAFHHINKAQSLSYDELQAQLGIGPQVALKSLAKTEFLVELQEAIQYKSQPELRENILNTWKTRFKRSHADANSWLKRLEIWTLACPPSTYELQSCFLNTAKLCESTGMHEVAQTIIKRITPKATPPGCKVEYTKLRFEWKEAYQKQDREEMEKVLQHLHDHTDRYMKHLNINKDELEATGLGLQPLASTNEHDSSEKKSLSRRFYRLGEWTAAIQDSDWIQDKQSTVLTYTSLASKLDPVWHTAAFSLAERSITLFEKNGFSRSDSVAVGSYIVPALRAGLFQAARTKESPEYVIKALLRLVTLWFRFGENHAVLVEVENQLNLTDIEPWLSAIPQLIARLGTPHKDLQFTLISLLKTISSHYPHAVIWPLLTATQTKKVEHQTAARVIMDFICSMPDGTRLVNQAELVGKELIRTSISWIEKWKSLIDRYVYISDLAEIRWQDVPLIWEEQMKKLKYPETPDEEYFVQQFGEQLQQVNKMLVRYGSTRQLSLVNNAYPQLSRLSGEFDAQLKQWTLPGVTLHLASVAPRLLGLRDCILTVPGKYDPHLKLDDQLFIDSFRPTLHVLSSNQLPRKLVIRSYLNDHTFLLKGKEDLRGHERIMQLFNLINTLLNHRSDAFSRNLHLLPYEVVPLSPSAGLVSWVPNTQQLQSIIQANRDKEKNHSLTNKERASLIGYDLDTYLTKLRNPKFDIWTEMSAYDKFPLSTKVQCLKTTLSYSNQSDLRDVLWQRSPDADIWIRRRTNFARTIGVASFVGYIIGLGDRHGSNILIDQLTWGVLHIDFGDLFNIAQERPFCPEKVPFRLTRMMTNAFELASRGGLETPGSRGSFKQASLITMDVLRYSRSTLLAMLETFLYDPLLSWNANQDIASEAVIRTAEYPNEEDQKFPHVQEGKFADDAKEQKTAKKLYPHKTETGRHVPTLVKPQSIVGHPVAEQNKSNVIDNMSGSLTATYLQTNSYMAKVSSTGMTNSKALQVLAQIERKLIGFNEHSEQPLTVKKQVQELIEDATDLRNLSQGYVWGWLPHW